MAIFTDIELASMAVDLHADHDRKLSVPVLRDVLTVVENELFKRLGQPGKQLKLGRICTISVEKLEIPDEPQPPEEPEEFYLCAIASDDLTRSIEDFADLAPLPMPGDSEGMERFEIHCARRKNRLVSRGEDE